MSFGQIKALFAMHMNNRGRECELGGGTVREIVRKGK